MKKVNRRLFVVACVVAGAVAGSALMFVLTPGASWVAFVGWAVFFVAVQTPFLLSAQNSLASCAGWLTRLRGKA